MSYFSAALERVLEDLSWSQQDLIASTGIHRTSMSSYVRGSAPVGRRTLHRICKSFPEKHWPHLVRGWLLDQLPRQMQSMIEIVPRGGGVIQDRPLEFDCPDDVRRGLLVLARRSLEAPVRDLVIDLSRVLSAEHDLQSPIKRTDDA